MRRFLVGLFLLLGVVAAQADTTIFNSLPYNLQNGTTADAAQVMANFNQIIANGNANATAKGANSTITSLSGLATPPSGAGSLFYNGTTIGGTANAVTIGVTYPINMAQVAGACIRWQPTAYNTGATTLNVLAHGPAAILKPGPTAAALTGGELTTDGVVETCWDGTQWRLSALPANAVEMPETYTTVASNATVNLAVANCPNHKCLISGTTTITSFGSGAVSGEVFYLEFSNILQITYNATSLITPGAANITTAPNDTAMAVYLGSGNWQILRYNVAIQPLGTTAAPFAYGLVIKNDSVTPATKIDLTATSALITNAANNVSTVCTNLNVVINTAVTGANGLDTGTRAASTWYYVYAISNGSTCAGLVSTSATSPTLPGGYTMYARFGAMATDGSVNFYRTRQAGNRAQYTVTAATNTPSLPLVLNGSTGDPTIPTWTAFQVTGNGKAAPTTAASIHLVVGELFGGGATQLIVAPNNQYGAYNSVANPPPCAVSGSATNNVCSLVLESNSVYAASNMGAATIVNVLGWTDSVPAN